MRPRQSSLGNRPFSKRLMSSGSGSFNEAEAIKPRKPSFTGTLILRIARFNEAEAIKPRKPKTLQENNYQGALLQ